MKESQKRNGEVYTIFVWTEIVFVVVFAIGQVMFDDRDNLFSIVLERNFTDVIQMIQFGMVMVYISYDGEVKSGYCIFYNGEVGIIRHKLVNDTCKWIGIGVLGMVSV